MRAAKRRSWALVLAAITFFAAPAAFASIPRSTIITSTSIDFRTIEPVDVDASIDNSEFLARALDRSFPASAPADTLSESRVWVSRLERPLFHQEIGGLTRSLRQGSVVAWSEVASERTVLTPDPLGYKDSSNLYAFAKGDPVNGRDPTGEMATVTPKGNIVVVSGAGGRYTISAEEARRDPVAVLRILESDPDLSFADQERIMTEAGLRIPYSSACRSGESCIGSARPNNRAFTHAPKGGAWGYTQGAAMAVGNMLTGAGPTLTHDAAYVGFEPKTREQQFGADATNLTAAVVGTVGAVKQLSGARAQVRSAPDDPTINADPAMLR